MATPPVDPDDDRDLVLSLDLAAPRAAVWRCWTEADLLKRWFAPAPWTTPEAELDVRPGGRQRIVMRSPEGEDMPMSGVYLEVVPEQRLVATDAYSEAWVPSAKPFMTVVITLADGPHGGTAYSARVRHWTAEDQGRHAAMGFRDGWTRCARQLEAVANALTQGRST